VSIPSLDDETPVPGLDPVAAARWRARPAGASPWLHEAVARRMVERLQWFRQLPASWLHWEPVNGGLQAHQLLRERLGGAQEQVWAERLAQARALTGMAAARPRWLPARWLGRGAAAPSAPAEPQPTDMLWANMLLHLEPRPLALLRRWQRLVRPHGFLMFSCLGPDSLGGLRALYARRGWHPPAHPFTDMHDWGDMLVQVGFAEPVMDVERIVLTWSSAEALLAELRTLGRNLHAARPAGLRGRGWRERLVRAIEEELPRTADGRLQLEFEIVYGHAYQGEPRRQDPARIPLEEMRAMLRRRPA
jgi:malonyl-CoA O-methyltransferase